jgi:hypothetical protein
VASSTELAQEKKTPNQDGQRDPEVDVSGNGAEKLGGAFERHEAFDLGIQIRCVILGMAEALVNAEPVRGDVTLLV